MLHYGFLNSPIGHEEGNISFLKNKKKFMNFGNYNLSEIKSHLLKRKNVRPLV